VVRPQQSKAVSTPGEFLLTDLLRAVSRSFYLTLRILPAAIRTQISLAYLLARTTDTVADTELIPLEQRLESLRALRERIGGTLPEPLRFEKLARQQALPGERVLLENFEQILACLARLTWSDQQRIREVLATISSGQELDLRRFKGAGARQIAALQTDAELDDYTYRVAGCVGEFWTRMCRAHLLHAGDVDETRLLANSVRFGQGLQLVNILRDLPADLRRGRCYVPGEALARAGLAPADLLDLSNQARFRPLYQAYLDQAEAHLAAGWAYTNALPRRWVRVRLACSWPILIGVRTLDKLRTANVLDARQPIKISRGELRAILCRSLALYPLPWVWKRLGFPRQR
jgi:farnesyl-diphosphate farnesyltransferase